MRQYFLINGGNAEAVNGRQRFSMSDKKRMDG
jgi:hypothetical protein